jgi:hypothetical protein
MIPVISDVLYIPRSEFQIEDPWAIPSVCSPVRLRRATDGKPPRLSTMVAAYSDGTHLTFVFCAADDPKAVATHRDHDAPLYKEDVVEVFLAPSKPTEYFEFEVSPLGTTFDARIESPNGTRAAMKVDLEWDCRGLFAGVRRASESSGEIVVDTVIRIPYESIGAMPRTGDEWRANLFRVDRSETSDEYSAWQPTHKDPPDFHVASAFGKLRFESG